MVNCKFLSEEDRQILISSFGGYLQGWCFIFAIAVSRGMGAQLVCVEVNGKIVHAGVKVSEKAYRDVRGESDLSTFVSCFVSGEEFSVRETDEEELKRISFEANGEPIDENLINRAKIHAESMWPEWEWKESHLEHLKAFTEELSTLCRKYGVWIREPYPTALPILYKSNGNDEQFELEQLISPNCQYLLKRTFK